MSLREHVLDSLAGPDIPLGYTVREHLLFVSLGKSLALSYVLHDLEGCGLVESLHNEVEHDTVTRTHNLGYRTGTVFDKLLRVSEPYVGTVCKTGYLKKVSKGLGLCVKKNLLNELGAHLGYTVRAELTSAYIIGGNAERLCRLEELVDRAVIHLYVEDARVCIFLKHLILGRHIVSELVELEYRIVQIRELEVRGYNVGIRVICGMLYRCEVIDIVLRGYNYDTSGMLTCSTLDTDESGHHMRELSLRYLYLSLLEVLVYVAPRRLICESTDSARAEHVSLTEELLGVLVDSALYVTREVKVDIGRLVTLKSEEGLKGDIVSVLIHPLAALGTLFVRQVKAGAHRAVCEELAVATLGTSVVRRQGVNLGDTRHRRYEGRAYRATRAYEIAEALGVCNKLNRDHIEHGKSVFDYGIELSLKSLFNELGQGIAVPLVRPLPAAFGKLYVSAGNVGLISALGNGTHVVAHIRYHIRVGDNNLFCDILTEIRELVEHLLSGTQIDGSRLICIRELHTRKKNASVYLVLLV